MTGYVVFVCFCGSNPLFSLACARACTYPVGLTINAQRVFDIIHPSRRNLTAIRGYVRLGGLPDNPRTDPQDRAWFGPHDRLFTEEESELVDFMPSPHHGARAIFILSLSMSHP